MTFFSRYLKHMFCFSTKKMLESCVRYVKILNAKFHSFFLCCSLRKCHSVCFLSRPTLFGFMCLYLSVCLSFCLSVIIMRRQLSLLLLLLKWTHMRKKPTEIIRKGEICLRTISGLGNVGGLASCKNILKTKRN